MANRVEDAAFETPSAHSRKHEENVPELHDESIEEDSDSEEEFSPEDVQDEPPQHSGFSRKGPADARAVSLNTVRQIQAAKEQAKTKQSQPNSQPVSQKKTPVPPRQVDPKRYG